MQVPKRTWRMCTHHRQVALFSEITDATSKLVRRVRELDGDLVATLRMLRRLLRTLSWVCILETIAKPRCTVPKSPSSFGGSFFFTGVHFFLQGFIFFYRGSFFFTGVHFFLQGFIFFYTGVHFFLHRGSFFFTQKTMLRRNPTDVPTWGVPRQ